MDSTRSLTFTVQQFPLAFPTSALHNCIHFLREGRLLDTAAIDEIKRLLDVLRSEGWSGFIPADAAAQILADACAEKIS